MYAVRMHLQHYDATWCSICVPHSPNTKRRHSCIKPSAPALAIAVLQHSWQLIKPASNKLMCVTRIRLSGFHRLSSTPHQHNNKHNHAWIQPIFHQDISINGVYAICHHEFIYYIFYVLAFHSKSPINITCAMTTRSWWWYEDDMMTMMVRSELRLLISKAC